MKTVEASITAWLTKPTPMRDIEQMSPEEVVNALAFFSHDMSASGWTPAGTATITVTFHDRHDIDLGQVAVLNKAKQCLLAKTQAAINEIDGQIQSLLCLEAHVSDHEADDALPEHKRPGYAERMYEAADDRRKELRENAL